MELDKLKRIDDLHKVWKREDKDFTRWLAKDENLALLGEAIGIDLVLEEIESNVGSFHVDIFATEESSGRKVIIENQLTSTDHDHLGKLITYASGKDASYVVWIVRNARDEHRQAIEWLNQHTDENVGFFLLEIEIWQIADSPYAPKFNVVERPNEWTKEVRHSCELTPTKSKQLAFWQAFNEYAARNGNFCKSFKLHKPYAQHWYDLSIGTGKCFVNLTVNSQSREAAAGIYIPDNKDFFHSFDNKRKEWEDALGCGFHWTEANKATRFFTTRKFDLDKTSEWDEVFAWFCDITPRIKANIYKYL